VVQTAEADEIAEAIMHAGGWKSPDMVMRYIEHMDVQRPGTARMYSELSTQI
jgi:hypothetical protein